MVNLCLSMLPVHKESRVHKYFDTCSSVASMHTYCYSCLMCKSYENVVVEQISGRDHILNHLSIPAACFTHPEISIVGLTEVSQGLNCYSFLGLPCSCIPSSPILKKKIIN